MGHGPDRKFFGGEVSQDLSDRIDHWIAGHGDSKKRQLAGTLAEFFLALDEPLQGYLLIAPVAMARTIASLLTPVRTPQAAPEPEISQVKLDEAARLLAPPEAACEAQGQARGQRRKSG